MSFGDRVSDEVETEIRRIMEILNAGGTSKYLGLTECFSGSKVDLLSYIKEKSKS